MELNLVFNKIKFQNFVGFDNCGIYTSKKILNFASKILSNPNKTRQKKTKIECSFQNKNKTILHYALVILGV
jgi:hypothetical protein